MGQPVAGEHLTDMFIVPVSKRASWGGGREKDNENCTYTLEATVSTYGQLDAQQLLNLPGCHIYTLLVGSHTSGLVSAKEHTKNVERA